MIDIEYRNKHWREAKKFVLAHLPNAAGMRFRYGDCSVAANQELLTQRVPFGEERLTLGECNRNAGMGYAWIHAAKRLGWKP